MARPRLHNFPPQKMLVSIGRILRADLDAEQTDLAKAQATMAAEQKARDESDAAREAAGLDYREWYKLHPDPPRSDAWLDEHGAKHRLEALQAWGIPYNLPLFTGCDLTPSARVAAQTAIRKLESDGLVKLTGAKARYVSLTAAGWERLKEGKPDASP